FYHYGLLEMIESEVRAGLDIDPVNRLEAYRLRGTAALVSGRFQEALHWLGEAQKLSAPEVTAWYYAQSLYYAGDRHVAESLLQPIHADPAFGRLLSDLQDQLQLARTRYR